MRRMILAFSLALLVGLLAVPPFTTTAFGTESFQTVTTNRYWVEDDTPVVTERQVVRERTPIVTERQIVREERPIVRERIIEEPNVYYYEPGFSIGVPFFSFRLG